MCPLSLSFRCMHVLALSSPLHCSLAYQTKYPVFASKEYILKQKGTIFFKEMTAVEDLPLSYPDPVVLELHRLQIQLKEKEKELLAAQCEIESLKANEAKNNKAFEELKNDASKLEEKLCANDRLLEQQKLGIKKLEEEKEDALAAQYAAEATLRRVYTDQKDDDSFPLESVIAPLEAEIKLHKQDIAALQEDKKALERLTKSKESALLEAEKILKSALERALIVEEVQNQNFELRRQIEICQEENKILEKTNRQKVLEIEKFCQTIQELEEAILAGGTAANAIRDYRRQISELNEEKRTLERELARVKVSANRVALAVANEWKDENDRVMPLKKWLEERRLLHGEMQRSKDKLAIAERTAKAEAQLKERLKLRLKTIEESLKNPNTCSGSAKTEKSGNILGFLTTNGGSKKRSTSQPRASIIGRSYTLGKSGICPSRNREADNDGKENSEMKANADANVKKGSGQEESKKKAREAEESKDKGNGNADSDDTVSGFLYDRLQKEVINLRKACEARDSTINAKDEEIKMLMKKIDALTKAIEVETKKAKREAAAREKENALPTFNGNRKTIRHASVPKSRMPNSR